MTLIAPTLQAYFSDLLVMQLQASPRMIASYRDTLRLLLCFVQERTGRAPSALGWDELDEPLIAAFLEHLEVARHNSARTRNLRLTASKARDASSARSRSQDEPKRFSPSGLTSARDSARTRCSRLAQDAA